VNVDFFGRFFGWLSAPIFTIGGSPITLRHFVSIAFVVLVAWWISVLLETAVRRVAASGSGEYASQSSIYAFGRIARYTVWVLGTLIGLSVFGIDLTNLAILGGAIGVGIGIGLQNLFSNLVSGIVILLEKSLRVGDFVDLQSGVVGRVSEISMRYTRVTTNDLVNIFVPNSEFTGGRVINWSYGENSRRIHVPFGVAYGSDKAQVREAGIAAARTIEGTIDEEDRRPDVWLVGFGDSSLNFELVVWVDDILLMAPAWTSAKYLWAIEDELRKRGLEIPFPQRDLHLRSGSLRIERADGSTRAVLDESD
jgi:small-conductance mechanosensitive channel